MSWHIDGVGGGGGRIASEFWKTKKGIKGGWVDADPWEPRMKRIDEIGQNNDYGYYIFTEAIAHLEDFIIERLGQRIDIDGYNRRPELPMTALSIKEVRDKVAGDIADKIFKDDLVDCESTLFTVAFGGGTGTGIINPVTEILRRRTGLSVYALGVLPEYEYGKYMKNIPFARQCFNTAWALCELLAKSRREGVDAVFLVDNEALEGTMREEKNKCIFESLFSMINPGKLDKGFIGLELRGKLTRGMDMPPIIVPCYYSTEKEGEDIETLLEKATEPENCLIRCDYTKADSVVVFTSLLSSDIRDKIERWIKERMKISEEEIYICRVWSHNKEILMLLRNPYGGGEGDPFFDRLSDIIDRAIEFAKGNESENIMNLISIEELKKYKDRVDFINFIEKEVKSELRQNRSINRDILEGFNREAKEGILNYINNR